MNGVETILKLPEQIISHEMFRFSWTSGNTQQGTLHPEKQQKNEYGANQKLC